MLRSNISENIFNEFTSSYQSFTSVDAPDRPFVYVDTEGNIKLLTNVIENDALSDGIFAVSIAQDGWMEFLAIS